VTDQDLPSRQYQRRLPALFHLARLSVVETGLRELSLDTYVHVTLPFFRSKMTEPSDKMQEIKGHDTAFNLVESFYESESEDESEDVDVGEALHNFLTLTIKGPQLDEKTVVLLFNNGVEDLRSFLLYSKQSYQEMLSPISTNTILNLNQSVQQGIQDVKIYRGYIFAHDLVDENGDINLEAVDPQAYQVYLRSHRREARAALQEAVGLELNARVAAKQARMTLKSTLHQSLELLLTTAKMNDKTPTCHVTLNTPPPHVQSAGSPSTGENMRPQDHAQTDPLTESFLRKLDYPEDESADLSHMVTPTKEELETPMRSGATLLPEVDHQGDVIFVFTSRGDKVVETEPSKSVETSIDNETNSKNMIVNDAMTRNRGAKMYDTGAPIYESDGKEEKTRGKEAIIEERVDGFRALLFWLTSLIVEGRIVWTERWVNTTPSIMKFQSFLMRRHVKFKNVSSWIQGSFQRIITSCNVVNTNSVGTPSLISSNIEMGEILHSNKTFRGLAKPCCFLAGRSEDD
jgi:uncharacterized coiled-coil protein SlyX